MRRLDYSGDRDFRIPKIIVTSPIEEELRVNCCAKEPETVKWIEEIIKDGETVLDIGANVGSYSLLISAMYPLCRVVALEPHPANFNRLLENIALNNMYRKITPLNVGIALQNGLQMMRLNMTEPGYAFNCLEDLGEAVPNPKAVKVDIMTFTLTSLCYHLKLYPDHIKLDIDGGEGKVMKNWEALLGKIRPKSLNIEVDTKDSSHKQVYEVARKKGYKLISDIPHPFNPSVINAIFVSS